MKLTGIDETFALHERLTPFAREYVDGTGYFYATWVVPGALFSLFMLVLSARFLLSVDAMTRALMIASGILFVGGAVGMEAVGWNYLSANYVPGNFDFIYLAISTCEECMEMLGSALFLFSLVRHAEGLFGPLELRLTPAR